jgi:hypothetical protein
MCPWVDEFRDDALFECMWGKEAAAIQSLYQKNNSGESPLLPSPLSSLKPGVIPKFFHKKINGTTEILSVEE